MGKLTGQTIAASYDQLLIVDDTDGISASLQAIESGDTGGSAAGLKIATNKVEVIPGSNDANAFEVSQADGTAILTINSSTPAASLTGTLTVSGITKVGTAAGSGADAYLYTAGAAAHVGIHWDADGDTDGTLYGGVDNHGIDFKFYGETASKYVHWDQSADTLIFPDSTPITLGTGSDATIQFDATNTVYNTAGYHSFTGGDVHVGNGQGLVIGHTAQETISIGDGSTDLVPEVQVLGTGQADSSLMLAAFSATATSAGAPLVALVKSGDAAIDGTHVIVTDGEELGNIIAYGDDGVDLESPAASIQFEVDGTPGAGDMPGRILFNTSPDGGSVLTEAMRISQDGTQNQQGNYIVNEQGRTDHVSNTMSAPFYRFDGVNDHIVIADSPHLSFGDSTTDVAFSITAWINMEDASDFAIVSKGTAWTAAEWFLTVNGSDKIDFTVLDQSTGDAYEKAVYDTSLSTLGFEGKWIHIAATYNGVGGTSANAGMSLYLNGVSVATTLTDAGTYVAMENGAGEVHIGRYGGDYAQGSISKVRIWNVELDATEVKEDYSGMAVHYKYQGGNETDLVTNGAFGADSDWNKGTNWTISSGTANAGNVTGTVLQQDIGAVVGKTFRTKYTVSSYVDGTIHSNIGAYIDGTLRSANGTYLDYFYTKHPSSNAIFYFEGRTAASLSIDNASCVRVGCVAEYDATGIVSDKWFDKSGNELHGVVTGGATTENTAAAPVISEQHPAFLAVMATNMLNMPTANSVVHKLDDEIFDNGNNFHSTVKTSAADATESSKLHDADGGFESSDVGSNVWNSTDSTWTTVTAFVDSGELTLNADIMASGETYFLYKSTFTAPVTGKYHFDWAARLVALDTAASYTNWYLQYTGGIVAYSLANTGISDFGAFTYHESILLDLDANDTVYVSIRQADGTKQMDIIGDGSHSPYTFLSGHLVC